MYLVIYFQALMLILKVLCTAVLQTGEPDPDKNLIDPSPIELKTLSTGPIRKKNIMFRFRSDPEKCGVESGRDRIPYNFFYY